jgi:hypothetical protein
VSGVWSDGLQWMVHVLQKLQKNGPVDNPIRRQALVPRGQWSPWLFIVHVANNLFWMLRQLMAMNVVPRLVLDDA